MFQAQFINKTKYKIPQKYLKESILKAYKQLKENNAFRLSKDKNNLLKRNNKKKVLVLVFISKTEMKKTNFSFRKKNKTTDILSFISEDASTLGELILCPEVVRKQAANHGLSVRQEYLYLLIHGILHLLGFDHELSKKNEEEMFAIQDKVFSNLILR